jgi:NAD(P)-dependent dehydrogenase (short-subunit alcohol dehydrogenase family)
MKTILVSGASRGIGRATALLCGARGWSVVVNYVRDEHAAQETVRAVQAAGGQAVAVRGDVALEPEVVELFAAGRRRFGALDGVVVNAGIVAPAQQLADMSAARLRRMVDVNVYGALLCAREAARHLSRARGGRGGAIVLVSSAATRLGSPNEYVDYAASKAALDTLTLGLAKELGPQGVRVNTVRPGVTETEIHASGGEPDRARRVGATTPLGRAGRAEEIAEAIVWLLGEASSYTSGAILDVAGGR